MRDVLPPESTDIFYPNVIDKYIDRPDELRNISLYRFAAWYTVSTSITTNVSSRCQPRIQLCTTKEILQKRRSIIRTPRFPTHSENNFYSRMLLHVPFTNESRLLYPYQTAKEAFIHKHDQFDLIDFQFE